MIKSSVSHEPTNEAKASVQPSAIRFRPIGPEDEAFLYEVYASTRAGEMALVDWDDEQKESFLRMQFNAQHQEYRKRYADDEFLIILSGDQPIGRLYLGRWADEFRIIDITLLPARRNGGIGTSLMQDIMHEAAGEGKPVRIHVEKNNPAMRLYRRLGFGPIHDQGVYLLMEWKPDAA